MKKLPRETWNKVFYAVFQAFHMAWNLHMYVFCTYKTHRQMVLITSL